MINKLYLSRFLTKDQTKKKRKANYECSEDKVLFQGVFFTVNSAGCDGLQAIVANFQLCNKH